MADEDPLEHQVEGEFEGPSFDDLLFDDTLTDLERIGRYATSAIALQRLVHVQLMSETAHTVGCVPRATVARAVWRSAAPPQGTRFACFQPHLLRQRARLPRAPTTPSARRSTT